MKKITLIVVLYLLSITVMAQKSVIIKFRYLPKHNYHITMKMEMEMSMDADSVINGKLDAQGVKQPMLMSMDMNMDAHISTGDLNAAKTFLYQMGYDDITSKITMNGKEMVLPKPPITGQKISGECDVDGKLHIDTINTPGTNNQLRATMTDMLNKMQAQIKFPEKPLAVGDTFIQEIPMNVPTAGMSIDFVIKTAYKLTALKGDQAFFDTDMTMTFDMNKVNNSYPMFGKATGEGTGKLVYDIAQNYPEAINSTFVMALNMGMKETKKIMRLKMKSNIQNVITSAN